MNEKKYMKMKQILKIVICRIMSISGILFLYRILFVIEKKNKNINVSQCV